MMYLSCGIVVYNEWRDIQDHLPKLKQELSEYQVEWIFVLNHEQQEVRQQLAKWIHSEIENALCIENPSNSLGLARQLILEKSKHDYLYLTDPDIEVLPGNLRRLIQWCSENTSHPISQKVVGYGGTVTHQSRNQFLQATFEFMSAVSRILPFAFQIQRHKRLSLVDHLPACHVLLDRQLALNLGGFSPVFSKCGEDLDFTHRAYSAGYRFFFLPQAEVVHWQNFSLSRWLKKMFTMGRVQIPVQRSHFPWRWRYYRLIPMLSLIALSALSLASPLCLLVLLAATLLLASLTPGALGFSLTFFLYATGQLFELVLQLGSYPITLFSAAKGAIARVPRHAS